MVLKCCPQLVIIRKDLIVTVDTFGVLTNTYDI